MIKLRQVSKTYGEGHAAVHALASVDLDVDAGEFVSIMGPSGSGKSTLLNLLSALDTPTAGSVVLNGHDVSVLGDDALTLFRRRTIGLIFQFFNLLPTLDVIDNVLLPVMLERTTGAADLARAESLLEEVGLRARRSHRTHQLSGGELQRVAIARALILEPKLILADEPTGNLDSRTGRAILQLLRDCCEKRDATVVMVTHDHDAAEVGDRVVLLHDGHIVSNQRASGRVAAAREARP